MAIIKFLGNSIISRLSNCSCKSNEEVRNCLKPDTSVGLNEWNDIGGLLAPRSEIESLIDNIESGDINDVETINNVFVQLHKSYYSLEWTWAWDKIQQYFDVSLDTITSEDVISIIKRWNEAVVDLDKMIYEDAKKEFSLSSRTGFGVDGDRYQQKVDFDQVRGVFEENAFVKAILQHIEAKTKLGEELINRLRQ